MIVSNTIIAVQNYVGYIQAVSYTLIVFIIVGEAGSAGILVNSLQFGIDQLTDASSSEIMSYISWYVWNCILAISRHRTSGYIHFRSTKFNNMLSSCKWYWLIPPEVLYGIAQYIMLTSSLEFIVAQAPYSMRGLLFGIIIYLHH